MFKVGVWGPGSMGLIALRGVMAGELAKSPYLSILSDERIDETLHLMLRPSNTKLTPQVAAEICERTGSGAVVEGSIAQPGGEYLVALRARNCRTTRRRSTPSWRACRRSSARLTLAAMPTRVAADRSARSFSWERVSSQPSPPGCLLLRSCRRTTRWPTRRCQCRRPLRLPGSCPRRRSPGSWPTNRWSIP